MELFDKRIANLPISLWQSITQVDEIKGEWRQGAGLGPQALGRLKRSVLVTSTGASTRIEGAQLSDDEVERLMRGLSMQQLADRDAQEVRGYYEVLQFVFDSWSDIELTENTIKQLHTMLLQHTNKDKRHRGRYKTLENSVHAKDEAGQVLSVLFETTPAYLTGKQMEELVTWTNRALADGHHHSLVIIANFVVELLKIHPFLDGNGRLSRILTNLLMLRAGYGFVPYVSHERLIERSKAEYYLALRRSQTTFGTTRETIHPWLEFFLQVCLSQARSAVELLSAAAIEPLLSPSQLRVWHYLGSTAEAAPGEIAAAVEIPRPTVNQSLDKLVKLGQVERLGLGRATRYRRVGDLSPHETEADDLAA
jgi:Fic family protein